MRCAHAAALCLRACKRPFFRSPRPIRREVVSLVNEQDAALRGPEHLRDLVGCLANELGLWRGREGQEQGLRCMRERDNPSLHSSLPLFRACMDT